MMSIRSKQELARTLSVRYRSASVADKRRILDEFAMTCGYNRKYALSVLRNPPVPQTAPITRPRARRYGERVQRALALVWEASDCACAKRLVPFLAELVDAL